MTNMVDEPNDIVRSIDRSFGACGVASPAMMNAHLIAGDCDVVIIDSVRCSTTLLATLAAGAAGIVIQAKPASGRIADMAERHAGLFGPGRNFVTAGETHGGPIPGAAFGNSAIDLPAREVLDKVVYFFSTNFGASWEGATRIQRGGSQPRVFVGALANADALAATLRASGRRLVLCLGGFYNRSSIEDHVTAGRILIGLEIPISQMDDDARLMRFAADHYSCAGSLLGGLRDNRIGTALHHFGRRQDLAANVTGEGIEPNLWSKMQKLVPTVVWMGNTPVLVAGGERPPILQVKP